MRKRTDPFYHGTLSSSQCVAYLLLPAILSSLLAGVIATLNVARVGIDGDVALTIEISTAHH